MTDIEIVQLTVKELYFCPECGQEVVSCEACDENLCQHQNVVCELKDDAEHHHYHTRCVNNGAE